MSLQLRGDLSPEAALPETSLDLPLVSQALGLATFPETPVMTRRLYSNVLPMFVLLLSVPLLAQSTGSIRGTVTDQAGSVIANASTTLTETNTQLTRSAQSNSDGIFVFSDLPVGNYTLTV